MSTSKKNSRRAPYVNPYIRATKAFASGAEESEIILGLDLSLRKTGVAVIWNSGHETFLIEPPEELREGGRLLYIERELRAVVNAYEPNYAVIEGYSYGSLTGQFALGEVGGIARLVLTGNHIPYVIVPPTSLKKYVTGNGNATKIVMALQVQRELDLSIHDDNECDAYCLAALGSHVFELDLVKFTSNDAREQIARLVRENPTSAPKKKRAKS
jgi:crossover junction endodeoxyribonuclease RuvC